MVGKTALSDDLGLVYDNRKGPAEYMERYSRYITKLIKNLDYSAIEDIVSCFAEARKRSATIFFAGNGGSAATALHFAQDLAEVGRKSNTRGFNTLSLTSNVSFITALANDYGYDHIFTGQMADVFKKGDVLVAISASGNSPNVVKAAQHAKEAGGVTVALVGFDGGSLSGMCDRVLHIKTKQGEYGPVEDIHMFLDHMITSYLTMKLYKEKI